MSDRQGSFAGRMTAMAGGLAVGALGSRLLPPLLARATGSVRTRMGADPFERLREDHRRILTTVARMQDGAEKSFARRAALFLSLKRTLGKHALAEEDVVYPALHKEAGAADAAMRLYGEHAELKIHLYELETALRTGAGWRSVLPSLEDVLRRHIRDEEDVEFPRLKALMDGRACSTLAGQISREEALML